MNKSMNFFNIAKKTAVLYKKNPDFSTKITAKNRFLTKFDLKNTVKAWLKNRFFSRKRRFF